MTGYPAQAVQIRLPWGTGLLPIKQLAGTAPQKIDKISRVYRGGGINALRRLDITESSKEPITSYYNVASGHAMLGEQDLAIDYLRKAYDHHEGSMIFVNSDRSLDTIRSDPRFQELVRRMGLPQPK